MLADPAAFAEYLTPAQAARQLDLSAQRVRQLVDIGQLVAVRTPLGRLLDGAAVRALARERALRRRHADSPRPAAGSAD